MDASPSSTKTNPNEPFVMPGDPNATAFINDLVNLQILKYFVESHYTLRNLVYRNLSIPDVIYFLRNRYLLRGKGRYEKRRYPDIKPTWIPSLVLEWCQYMQRPLGYLYVLAVGKNDMGIVKLEEMALHHTYTPEYIEINYVQENMPEYLISPDEVGLRTPYIPSSGYHIFHEGFENCIILGTGEELQNQDQNLEENADDDQRSVDVENEVNEEMVFQDDKTSRNPQNTSQVENVVDL